MDNIIAVHEGTHSFESDIQSPPRMMIKIDKEKACNSLEWNVALATLRRMEFLEPWISRIKAYIYSDIFFFKVYKAVRQVDPISPYLFILISQILSAVMDFSLKKNSVVVLIFCL